MIADCMAVGMLPVVSYPLSQLPAKDKDSFWRSLREQARFELDVGDGPLKMKAMRTLPVTVGECGTHLGLISKTAVVLLERNEEVTLIEGGRTLKAIKALPDLLKFWAAEKLMRIVGTLLAQRTLMLDERGYDPNMKLKLWNFSVKCLIVTLEQRSKTISIDVGCISVEFVLDGGVSESGIDNAIFEMDHHYMFGTGCSKRNAHASPSPIEHHFCAVPHRKCPKHKKARLIKPDDIAFRSLAVSQKVERIDNNQTAQSFATPRNIIPHPLANQVQVSLNATPAHTYIKTQSFDFTPR